MKAFTVKLSDLTDKQKNPGLVLSPRQIAQNTMIPKTVLKKCDDQYCFSVTRRP